MNIGILQYDVVWEKPDENLHKLHHFLDRQTSPIDILVLPEMFLTGFTMRPERLNGNINHDTLSKLASICAKYSTSICGSLPWNEEGVWYNRFFHLDQHRILSTYVKYHLFNMTGEDKRYGQGKTLVTYSFGDWNIRPLICFDLRFPMVSNNDKKINLLIYVANWPISRIHHWTKLLIARAIENQCYVVGVNRIGKDGNRLEYNGQSCLVDYSGEIILDAQHHECLLHAPVDLNVLEDYRLRFPFRVN